MRTYLATWLAATLTILLAVAAVNFVVDPYAVHAAVDVPQLNRVKPKAGTHGTVAKAYLIARTPPRALILGNSRAEVGLDPEHLAWSATQRPVFNGALPGSGLDVALRVLEHSIDMARREAVKPPAVVLLGLDFIDFLPNVGVPGHKEVPGAGREKSVSADMRSGTDWLQSLLTMDALLDSGSTVLAQSDRHAVNLTASGFNPMREFEAVAAHEGYRAMFEQKNASYIKTFTDVARLQKGRDIGQSESFSLLQRIVDTCRREGIELRLVMYPYHAQFLEAVRLTGLWPDFEAWKVATVRHLAEVGRTGGRSVPLWDFALYNEWTTEAVPGVADRQSQMQWYWEAGHFKKALGDRLLDQVLTPLALDERFGVRLNQGNVDAVLGAMRQGAQDYRTKHAADSDALRRQVQAASARRARLAASAH